jgi:hypothetical protein
MKRPELYKILINNKEVYGSLTELEYLDLMENYALEYYQTGSPHPDSIKTIKYKEVKD